MEVVRQNFKETLPQISASIKKADFLVIDAEFTGLNSGREVSMFDLPKDYYKCLLDGSTEFLVIQFGLCAFYWDEERKHYMNDAFNFYLFPRGRPGPEKIFLCQSSSLDFLSAQGFDFNKVIRDGISYMTEPHETKLREALVERQKQVAKEKDIIAIPEENKAYIEDSCKKVREFLDEGKQDEITIDRCNAFVRLLLYQEIRIRFKDEVILETKILENKNRILKVLRVKSGSDETDHNALKKEKEWEELEAAVGFSKVARMISQSEKLVIGHNMILDVIHTLNNFFHPLPADFDGFKEFAHCMFPSLLDTKYMSSLPPFKDKVNSSVLHHLLATLSEAPFSLPKVGSYTGRGYMRAEDKHHEAGYDAYITGLCFLSMYEHLSRMRGETHARVATDAPALRPFLNKLYLAKTAYQDSPYINLCGIEPTPTRDHVFHLTFPKEWTRNDINLLFSPYGPITCQFVDDTHAIVALTRRDQARLVMRGMTSNSRVKLVPYDKYNFKTQMDSGKDHTALDRLTKFNKIGVTMSSSEVKNPPASVPNLPSVSSSPCVPEKVPRVRSGSVSAVTSPPRLRSGSVSAVTPPLRLRSGSVSAVTPPATQARKRTSSGVFQVDDVEPLPKKTEHTRSNSDGALKKAKVTNGRRKVSEKPESEEVKEKKHKIIERFDSEAKSKCVSAFKESDTWD